MAVEKIGVLHTSMRRSIQQPTSKFTKWNIKTQFMHLCNILNTPMMVNKKKYTYRAGEQQSPNMQRSVYSQFFSAEQSDSNKWESAALCGTTSIPEQTTLPQENITISDVPTTLSKSPEPRNKHVPPTQGSKVPETGQPNPNQLTSDAPPSFS